MPKARGSHTGSVAAAPYANVAALKPARGTTDCEITLLITLPSVRAVVVICGCVVYLSVLGVVGAGVVIASTNLVSVLESDTSGLVSVLYTLEVSALALSTISSNTLVVFLVLLILLTTPLIQFSISEVLIGIAVAGASVVRSKLCVNASN